MSLRKKPSYTNPVERPKVTIILKVNKKVTNLLLESGILKLFIKKRTGFLQPSKKYVSTVTAQNLLKLVRKFDILFLRSLCTPPWMLSGAKAFCCVAEKISYSENGWSQAFPLLLIDSIDVIIKM